ncbi:hypothetical protein [Brevundimonas sp.]|uniref:hypothetical protein n=1 Tax=Brevundimonas sp. TaxID=1871086 RepID=UPI003D0D4889
MADISNSGTLFAIFMMSIAVMALRKADPSRHADARGLTRRAQLVFPRAMVAR